jgi:hypothetical protein
MVPLPKSISSTNVYASTDYLLVLMHVASDMYFHIVLVSSMWKLSKVFCLGNFTLIKGIIKVKFFY